MAEYKGKDIFDVLLFIARRKTFFIWLTVGTLLIAYLSIYVFFEEQYESTATVVPVEEDGSVGIAGMMKSVRGLPLGLSRSSSDQMDMFETIVYSRTTLEEVIHQFNLYRVYKIDTTNIDYREKAVKVLARNILTKETDQKAYMITIRANDPNRSAEMTNFVVQLLNQRIIDLRVGKSRDNRLFLENRLKEINSDLKAAEDSLRVFQEHSQMYEIESQLKEILKEYSSLESEVIAKQLEKNILERLYGKESGQFQTAQVELQEYEKKTHDLQTSGQPGGLTLAMKTLPHTSLEYLRRFRDVKIGNALLEFVTPLYEQSRFDEKKDSPILQTIDYAIPPARKSYPPRALFSLLITFGVNVVVLVILVVRDILGTTANPKIMQLRKELGRFRIR
jgi:uncharacterized protein involved in exopolysaccharide biosynthesis